MPTHYTSHYPDMINSKLGLAPVSITAGGSGDDTAQEGSSFDRLDYYSAVVSVPATATLAEGETATVSIKVQDSADDSTFADFKTLDDIVLTGDTGGSTETTIGELDLNLQGADRYIKVVVTVTMSAASTDTASFASTLSLTGAIENPV